MSEHQSCSSGTEQPCLSPDMVLQEARSLVAHLNSLNKPYSSGVVADCIATIENLVSRMPSAAQRQPGRDQIAKAIYAGWLDANHCTENHFQWFDAGKDNPESCVHYSNVAKALKVADRVLALSAVTPSPGAGEWQTIETAPRDGTEVFVWCDEGADISRYSEREEDGVDSMGHDAGWWGVRQPIDPGRHMGNPEYFREAENQPWAWMPINPPYDADGEKLFTTPALPSTEGRSHG